MKWIIYYIIPVLMLATACQKEECEAPLLNPEKSSTVPDTIWHLSMQIPDLRINFSIDAAEKEILFAAHNVPVGNSLLFVSSSDSVTVSIARHYDGTVAHLTGAVKGQTFIMIDDRLNICHGPQQVGFTYSISHS